MSNSAKDNPVIFQAFEWHTRSHPPPPHETSSPSSHWSRLTRLLPTLHSFGITALWLPPGCKANSPTGNGYDCYDIWDLGEFDQKWARSTKWGCREELNILIRTAKSLGVEIVWDAVLNHKTAGDRVEETWAVEVDPQDRRIEVTEPRKIEAWLRYDFPGRGERYSGLKWGAEHFSGTDWDQRRERNAIYKLIDDPMRTVNASLPPPIPPRPGKEHNNHHQGFNMSRFARFAKDTIQKHTALPMWKTISQRPGKGWLPDVSGTLGNYDYLLFSNIYYLHPAVRSDILNWGKWMLEEVGIDGGFRLDAAQHFSWNFTREWIEQIQETSRRQYGGREMMVVGEVLTHHVGDIIQWLDCVTPPSSSSSSSSSEGRGNGNRRLAYAFDTPLMYSFSRVSQDVHHNSPNADLRTLLAGPSPPPGKRSAEGGHHHHHHHPGQALVSLRPHQSLTFVTSHDTQTGQDAYVPMRQDLKALWYAFILLREGGVPIVFWGDLYGIAGDPQKGERAPAELPSCRSRRAGKLGGAGGGGSSKSLLPVIMLARKHFAHGSQQDYFDAAGCIGWVRYGVVGGGDGGGCAVILSILPASTIKKMFVGRAHRGERWVDCLSECVEGRAECVIDEDGCGVFACPGEGVCVYVKETEPVRRGWEFDVDVYRH